LINVIKNIKNFNIVFIYINEAHAYDIWPIGLSAGTLNKSHKNINDRLVCANKFLQEYDFNISTYLDNISNHIQNELSCWPFRWFVINYNSTETVFKFSKIGQPTNGEFDFENVI
jgi:hypothetical protein